MKNIMILLIIFLPVVSAEVYITEIMYNHPLGDNNKEYIELFSEEPVNLSIYSVLDFESEDNLTLLQQANASFYLIVEESFNYTNINATIYSAGRTIGNNLNNNGDLILIKRSGRMADVVIYANTTGADGDGNALCRRGDRFENRLYPCSPTPGMNNWEINQTPTNTTPQNTTEPTYDFAAIKINEVLPNPVGNDNAPLPQGEWLELYNAANAQIDSSGLRIKDKSDNAVTITNTNVIESTVIPPKGYLVVYMNGNSMFNNNGFEQVRLFRGNLALDEISYVDSKQGFSWSKIDDVFKITNATPGEENIFIEEQEATTIAKTQKPEEKRKESFLEITEIKPLKARFGDIVNVKLNSYRGDTRKNSLQVGINAIGKPITARFSSKYANYTLYLPLYIPENCNSKFQPGNHTIIVQGFGIKRLVNITIETGKCVKKAYAEYENNANATFQESFIKYKEANTKKIIYESTNVQVEKYATYLFWTAAVLIVAYIVYERKNKGKIDHRNRRVP